MCVWLRAMVGNVTACTSTITVPRTRASDRTVRSRGYPTYPGGHLLVLPLGGELARHRIIGADCGGDQASLSPSPFLPFSAPFLRCRGSNTLRGTGRCNFPTDSDTFLTAETRVLNSSILPINSEFSKKGISSPEFVCF